MPSADRLHQTGKQRQATVLWYVGEGISKDSHDHQDNAVHSSDGQVWGKALACPNLERRGELLEEDVDEEEEEQKKE